MQHAMGALYLLNIYYKKVRLTSKYLEIKNLDFSFGSSIFAVKRPSDEYVLSIINDRDITDVLQSDESPFIMKYIDSSYKQILNENKLTLERMNKYWASQPELQEPTFILQLFQAKEREDKEPNQKLILLWELSKYRLRKKIPSSLSFEERKRLFINTSEWKGITRQQNPHLTEDEITESNIDSEIERAGILAGMELEQHFENGRLQRAFNDSYCELVLDTGDIRYKK